MSGQDAPDPRAAEPGARPGAFRVIRRVPIVTYCEEVLLETDDWLAAHAKVMDSMPHIFSPDQELPHVVGVHPTHVFADGECLRCGACNNGSYGSHAPCGTEFPTSLAAMVEDWRCAGGGRS